MSRKIIIMSFFLALFLLFSCAKEVSVTPPDSLPPDGSMLITSAPDSFKIFVNGKDRLRLTPDTIKWLESGSYLVTLKRNLFLDSSFTVDVTEGQRAQLLIDFTMNGKFRGTLSINSKPTDAQIFLNDSNTTLKTPNTLSNLLPGIYKVTLKKNNYSDYTFYTTVSSSKNTNSNSTLIDTTKWKYFNTSNSSIASNGLSSITVDNSDNLWFGSREGLINYNGSIWSAILPGSSNFSHKVVTYVQADEKDRLWAVTAGGISLLENGIVVQKFTSTGSQTAIATGFGTDSLNSILVYHGTPYYYATDLGLGSATEDSFSGYNFNFDEIPNTNNKIVCMEKLNERTLLIGTAESGLVIKRGLEDYQVYNRGNSNIPGNSISAMYKDNDGVWIGHLPGSGTGGGISFFDGSNFHVESLGVPPPIVSAIFVSSKGYKFIGTDIGVFAFDVFANKVLLNEENEGLPIRNISGITEDSNGNIWIATKENGVFVLKKNPL